MVMCKYLPASRISSGWILRSGNTGLKKTNTLWFLVHVAKCSPEGCHLYWKLQAKAIFCNFLKKSRFKQTKRCCIFNQQWESLRIPKVDCLFPGVSALLVGLFHQDTCDFSVHLLHLLVGRFIKIDSYKLFTFYFILFFNMFGYILNVFFFYLFICLCRVLVAACGIFRCGAGSSLWRVGLSLVVVCRLSSCGARAL